VYTSHTKEVTLNIH